MKNDFYAHLLIPLLLLSVFSGQQTYAQCSCSGGTPANVTTYYYTLDTTDAASSIISFPKFDPTVGTLNCITFYDTLTGVSTTGVKNLSSGDVTYRFLLNVSNDITGPGISVNQSFNKNYGPSFLTAKGTLGDSTTYGPDTIFNHSAHISTTSNVSPYLGASGNVDFVYTLNGGLLSTQGGVNYNSHIETRYWGAFRIDYSWCPNSLLANGLTNFYLARNKRDIRLVWDITNENPDNRYVVEYSKDGKHFEPIGEKKAGNAASSHAKYQFNYRAGDNEEGYRSFRIRQVEASGSVRYSMVRAVLLEPENALSFQTTPNPAGKSVSISFYKPTTGNYEVEVLNMSGQIMFTRQYKLNNQYAIRLSLPDKVSGGMYFIKVTDTENQWQRINKLLVK